MVCFICFVNQLIAPELGNKQNFKVKVSTKVVNLVEVSSWTGFPRTLENLENLENEKKMGMFWKNPGNF